MYKRKKSVSLIEIICLSAILLNKLIGTSAQQSVDSSCVMNDGRTGICAMHYNCEFWQNKMRNREFPQGTDLCGYDNIDVIVCCPEQKPTEEPVIWPGNEGSSCTMETDGSMGVCTPIQNCKSRLEDIRQGRRQDTTAGHCSFDDFTEIVCCPFEKPTINTEVPMRPAERACRQYQSFADGRSGTDINTNIIAGQVAELGDFPFMVALAYRNNPDDPSNISYVCGGALITNRHVLTAAHCASNIQEWVPFEVRIGSTRLNRDDPDTQRIPISNITLHPLHRRSTNYYDIAIIELIRPVTFVVNRTMPICLQTVPMNSIKYWLESQLIVSGWGVTDYNSDVPSNELRYTRNLTLIDEQNCSAQYRSLNRLPRGVDDSLLCVLDTNPNDRSDACQGDSGGPLFLRQVGVSTIVGIVSFGQSCASAIASIYTSVYYHLDWIEQQVWPNEVRSRG